MAARKRASRSPSAKSISTQVEDALASLKRLGNARIRDEMGPRYGIHVKRAFGVRVGQMQQLAKKIGHNHDLALALWDDAGGWYEARMLAAFVDEPARVTPAQMDRWCRDFDNWGIVDTVCFKLFDQSPHAWSKVRPWSRRREEFMKRAGFVLMACLAAHDRNATDAQFLALLPLIAAGAADDRNFVKKGVSWSLRMIGRRSPKLRSASLALARRLAASDQPSCRWIGKDALRDLA